MRNKQKDEGFGLFCYEYSFAALTASGAFSTIHMYLK